MQLTKLKHTHRVRNINGTSMIDRTPPHSPEAEVGVLGCVLLSPNECMGQCIEKFKADGEVFYDLRHQTIFSTLAEMYDSREAIDIITVQQRLKDKQMLEPVGGIAYLVSLPDAVPSAANLNYYLDVVIEKHMLRRIISVCTAAVDRIYTYEGDISVLLDELEKSVLSIRTIPVVDNNIRSLVSEAIAKMEHKINNPGTRLGLDTGLIDLDKLTDGMHKGEMIVVAGYPSTGKTALAVNIACRTALKNIPVAIFSAEMQPVQLVIRSICAESSVNFLRVHESDLPILAANSVLISKAPLFIEQANKFTIGQVSAVARRLKQKHDIQLIVIDYIQLLKGEGDNREQEVSNISKGIKSMAMELNVPVLALTQLNDDGKIRESRAIGQDADAIWKLKNEGDWQPVIQTVKLTVEKCRDGSTGSVNLTFMKQYTRFENATEEKL